MTQLSPGDTAPAFELTSSSGEKVRLADYAGETVVVYFYPAALTPGCTLEAVDFNKAKEEFAKSGYQIIGISPAAASVGTPSLWSESKAVIVSAHLLQRTHGSVPP